MVKFTFYFCEIYRKNHQRTAFVGSQVYETANWLRKFSYKIVGRKRWIFHNIFIFYSAAKKYISFCYSRYSRTACTSNYF